MLRKPGPGSGNSGRAMSVQYKSLLASALKPLQLRQGLSQDAGGRRHAAAEQSSPSASDGARAARARSLKILLADDNAVNQDIATRMLERLGHEIELAGNGSESLEKATAQLYDVILMDMQMPDIDGLQATVMIRRLPPPHGQVPIIAVTANAFPTDRQACLDAGMNDFVSKPVTRDKLAAALEPWTGPYVPASAEIELASDSQWSLVDESHFASMRRELGDQLLRDLLVVFWASIPDVVDELQGARERNDEAAAARALHRLKGSAANLGLVGCQAACDEIRAQIQARGLEVLDQALPRLLATCRESERLSCLGA
jgi:two-component system, sensor histidine kinase and response regulator